VASANLTPGPSGCRIKLRSRPGHVPGGSCRPLSGVGYVARAIANPPLCVTISLPPKVKMTRTEIRPAFDPTLQPIGYALASELLVEGKTIEVPPAHAALCAPPDLFGWEWEHVTA
jgi:hypothetical protein